MTGTSLNPDCYLNEVLGRGAVQHVDALITPGCRPATSTLSGINKYFMPSPLSMTTLTSAGINNSPELLMPVGGLV